MDWKAARQWGQASSLLPVGVSRHNLIETTITRFPTLVVTFTGTYIVRTSVLYRHLHTHTYAFELDVLRVELELYGTSYVHSEPLRPLQSPQST